MSLFAASLLCGLLLLAAGLPLAANHAGAKAALGRFPRAVGIGNVVFAAAAAWFLYDIWHLSNADFGEYRTILFVGFGAVAVLSYRYAPDFLGVRGACGLVILGGGPFLDAAYMQYDKPLRLPMVTIVLALIALAIWVGAQPWRLRDFLGWLLAREGRSRALGAALSAYGLVLVGAAFALR
jgi:hypothetical protein